MVPAVAEKPLVWKLFDAAEGAVAPRLEEAVRSGAFLGGLGLAARVRAGARRRIDDRTRALWHLVNLPAGSDVARLRREVAALDRELRRMSTGLEGAMADMEERAPRRRSSGTGRTTADPEERDADDPGARNGRAPRARRAARPGAPRRGAQRAPGA
jgi:hypothetical protein